MPFDLIRGRAMTEGVKDCPNEYVLSPAQELGTDGNLDI